MTAIRGARKPSMTERVDERRQSAPRQLAEDGTGMARILVVDDEPKLVGFICRALSAQGFWVDGATGGVRALELIQERDYHLVVLDLVMGEVDGVTVLERALTYRPHLPVLVLSATLDVEAKVRCFQMGATDYMTKPFALAELRARIAARLRPPAEARGAILGSDGLQLDLRRRVATRGENTVRLSDREFVLLQHLMRNRGEVCSRAELLEEVWGCAFDPGTNVVDVYISRLRAKLGSSVIETVRNVGYYVPVA